MSRYYDYEAKFVHGIDGLGWAVQTPDGGYRVADGMTETEATITAFALNAIANGHKLTEEFPHGQSGCSCGQRIETYDGPTNGVAP